jgi:hypothetical protein
MINPGISGRTYVLNLAKIADLSFLKAFLRLIVDLNGKRKWVYIKMVPYKRTPSYKRKAPDC